MIPKDLEILPAVRRRGDKPLYSIGQAEARKRIDVLEEAKAKYRDYLSTHAFQMAPVPMSFSTFLLAYYPAIGTALFVDNVYDHTKRRVEKI